MPAATASDFVRFDAEAPRRARVRVEALARFLDSAVAVPGTSIKFGADAVIGIVPVIGTLATSALSAYLILEARQLGVPPLTLARMIGNIGLDAALGSIPLIGTVFDVMFRANERNMRILREHLDAYERGPVIEGVARRL